MLFIYPTPQYPRRPLEYVFKTMYLVANVIHVVALVVLIADFYTRLKDSMPRYFTQRELVISPTIAMIMTNCTYKGPLTLGSVTGQVEVGLGAVTIGLMNMAMYVQGLFILEFLIVCNHTICAFNYSTGNRHLRVFGVHIPFYHILVVFTYVYSIAVAVLTWVYDSNHKFYHRALQYCAGQLMESDATLLNEAEYADYSIFTTAVYWPFGAVCFGMLVYLSAAVVLFVHSYDKATVLLSRADAPWEGKGFLSMTKKPYLKLHTAQRNAIVEDARQAIKEGEKVRIVRSYQLMTEEDFASLVQAMKDQVARAIKEKQFEKLRENFGDRESQIDEMGFLWRQQMMQQQQQQDPQTPGTGTGDQFFDVNFGDYFTDNDYNELNASNVGNPNINNINNLDGDGGFDDPMRPITSPESIVEYNNDPLYPPEDDYGDLNENLPRDPDSQAFYNDNDGYPQEEEPWGNDGDVGEFHDIDANGRSRRHHHKHRRRRNSRSRGPPVDDWRDADDGYYGGGNQPGSLDYDEPDPRSPTFDDYSPQEGGGMGGYDDDYGNYQGGRQQAPYPPQRQQKKRKGGGRQAEIEDDLVDADALSDDPGFF